MPDWGKLVGLIYEAACDPPVWPVALAGMVAHVGGNAGVMMLVHRAGAVNQLEPLALHKLSAVDCLREQTQWCLPFSRLNPGEADWASDNAQSGSPVVLRLRGCFFKDGHRQGLLVIHGDRITSGQESLQTRRFQAVLSQVTRAVHLGGNLADLRQLAAGLALALDHLATGVFLADCRGKVLHANRAGADLVSAGGPLHLREGHLVAADHRNSAGLLRILQSGSNDNEGRAAPPVLHLIDRGDSGGLSLMAMTAHDPLAPQGRAPVLVFAAPRSARLQPETALLQSQFGLTRTEAEITAHLARGEGSEDIARRRGRSVATVRAQVKAIYAKLDITTQSQLVSLVARSLAALGRGGAAA